jgi:hypothetical protein
MKRLVSSIVALAVAGVVISAGAGAGSKRPPTTASLMPAYVQAAKYWQSRPLAPQHVRNRAHA